ncbi:NAD(P)-dependent oxidoreductase [Streptomyces sp. NPDC049585]|uniref:NAD-dependent epimerase/dehydratase family protein n=1 Tax=Streptomyces sp. NPDC049585 TaxID=3155154 RepID=UPI00342DE097
MGLKPLRIVLTGATGFIGGTVAAELLHDAAQPHVRVVGRSAPEQLIAAGAEWVEADLAEPHTLRGVCTDVDVLLHLASRVSGDPEQCHAVNTDGSAHLMAEAVRGGVERVTYLSTAAVYGHGPHRGADVEQAEPAPVSAASSTRLAAEQYALNAGGTVLRPGLVLGEGDRWVVPALAELRRRVPARWASGSARLSLVAVEDLARLIARTALAPRPLPRGVHHASHPEPVLAQDLMDALADHHVLPPTPADDWPWPRCLERLATTPGRISPRQFSLLAQDNWFRSDSIWRLAGVAPGPSPLERMGCWAPWYRGHLSRTPLGSPGTPASGAGRQRC